MITRPTPASLPFKGKVTNKQTPVINYLEPNCRFSDREDLYKIDVVRLKRPSQGKLKLANSCWQNSAWCVWTAQRQSTLANRWRQIERVCRLFLRRSRTSTWVCQHEFANFSLPCEGPLTARSKILFCMIVFFDAVSSSLQVKVLESIKILGVDLDDDLNFRVHIRGMCKEVEGMISILRRLKNLIPVNSRLLLYKSIIMPHLTYCHLVWHFCTASDSRKLQRLQERAVRLVYNTTTDSYDTLLKRAKLTTLQNRRLQDMLILMFKVKNELVMNFIIFSCSWAVRNPKSLNLIG